MTNSSPALSPLLAVTRGGLPRFVLGIVLYLNTEPVVNPGLLVLRVVVVVVGVVGGVMVVVGVVVVVGQDFVVVVVVVVGVVGGTTEYNNEN